MLKILSCIAVEHDPVFLSAAVVICVLGSLLTMRLFARVRNTKGLIRLNWLGLAGIIGGSAIWTTHFVAMMGYHAGAAVGYEPIVTLLSLGTAIAATTAGFAIATVQARGPLIEAGGVIVGLGIALMHFMGMSAYQVQGDMIWDRSYVVVALLFAAIFGALATNRVARPVTRFCRYGGGLALILAIVFTHFSGMVALTIVPDPLETLPSNMLPEGILMIVIVSITLVVMSLGATSYAIDIQTTQASVERYRHLSLHDALTGLPNRVALLEYMARTIERPDSRSPRLAILSFDLDRFKEINDVHGHAAGDHVLRTIAERLNGTLHEDEFVGRVGGDEFVAVKAQYYTRADAALLAKRVNEAVGRPIEWREHLFTVGCSIGISVYPDNAETIDDLLAQADIAMYRAKATGSGNICFFDVSMDRAARERNALAMDMRNGIALGEFELFYQRQNDTKTGRIVGFEVLLRWNHPVRGRVAPSEFIPIAEKTGLILELGDWVLREACREAAKWRLPLGIAVNVAPQQLADNALPQRVLEILSETGLAPSRLELEITESGIISDQQHALHIIRQLKSLGIKVAMDDYGTGYSSLSTLQLFPFDKIKIDRSFICGVVGNRQSAAIVRSTLILAASLDIPVLAEGVENEEDIQFLAAEGCQQVQGYFYGRPMARDGIEEDVNGIAESVEDNVSIDEVAEDGIGQPAASRSAAA